MSSAPAVTDRIVQGAELSGPLQEEERFARLQRELEDARGEYGLRRLDDVEPRLERLIAELRQLPDDRYALLLAAALTLQGRLHLRRADRARENAEPAEEESRREQQAQAFASALRLFRDQEGVIGEQSRLWTDYGIALFRAGDDRGAIRVLQRAQATGATPAEAFGYLGFAHKKLREFPNALEALKKGLQLDPGSPDLLSTLAETLNEVGQRSEAGRAYYQAAIAVATDKDLKKAGELLEAGLSADPENPQALSMLIAQLRSEKKEEEAAARLDKTLADFPENPWALGLRGMMRRDRGEIDEALEDFRRAEAGSLDLAWVWLEHAKTLAPRDQDAARALVSKAALVLGETDARVKQANAVINAHAVVSGIAELAEIAMRKVRETATTVAKSPMIREMISWLLRRVRENLGEQAGSHTERLLLLAAPDQALQDRVKQVVELAKSNPEQAIALLRNAPDREIALYRTAITSPSVSVKALEDFAGLLLERENYSEAAAVLEDAHRIAPGSSGLRELIDKGLALAPDTAGLLSLKAKVLDEQAQPAEAIRFYRRAARAAPENDETFKALVNALHRAGRTAAALDELDCKLAGSPLHGVALAEKGRLLLAVDRLNEAAPVLQDAETALANADAELLRNVRLNRGEALRRLDRYGEARDVFERAIAIDSALCDARAYQSALLIEIAEYDAAVTLLRKAIKQLLPREDDPPTRERLGWLWSAKGWSMLSAGSRRADELKEVEEIFRKALELTPDDPQAQKNLGWLLLRDPDPNRRAEGEHRVTRLIESNSDRPLPQAIIGWSYYLLRQYELGEYWLRSALSAQPTEIYPRFDLGLVLLSAGRGDEATNAFTEAAARTRERSQERQRGLFHVALHDLVAAAEEKRWSGELGESICDDLRGNLKEAGFPKEKLDLLQYSSAALVHGS